MTARLAADFALFPAAEHLSEAVLEARLCTPLLATKERGGKRQDCKPPGR